MADINIKFPTMDEFAKEVAEKALDEILYDGRSIREWIQIIASEDCISRQAVLDALHKRFEGSFDRDKWWNSVHVIDAINNVPSVNPQEQTGHWISHYDEDSKEGWYECDRCHTERAFNTDYCPDCGAKMVEPQESEE